MQSPTYRNDIDSLRAIAVIAVVAFHFGYLPNGYLGVDVFFVISGFLITKILFINFKEGKLSLGSFYMRRIRRIIPLTLFITGVALVAGLLVMLPNDLDVLSQSIVATNLFANNILEYITTKDYWDISNEYKPLMHTWSLGIEEQFYIFYPFLFLLFAKKKRIILAIIILITCLSLFLFFFQSDQDQTFYLLPYRFFELSFGGCVALIAKKDYRNNIFSFFALSLLVLLLCYEFSFLSANVRLVLVVVVTSILMFINSSLLTVFSFQPLIFIGKISFSIYMWHQLILAYIRYCVLDEIRPLQIPVILLIIFLLSVFTYYFIETPFRAKNRFSNRATLSVLIICFLVITSSAFYIYLRGGVIREVPSLELTASAGYRNMHLDYNTRHIKSNKVFAQTNKTKILVVGNSFARDWINLLQESSFKDSLEISYQQNITNQKQFISRLKNADKIFFTQINDEVVNNLQSQHKLELENIWFIGDKNFGASNGIFYNHRDAESFCEQRTQLARNTYKNNIRLKNIWGDRYIDLLALVIDDERKMPVFTPECKFISQDCKHFTKSGATYFAELLTNSDTKNLRSLLFD